jgi:hypothetical protein
MLRAVRPPRLDTLAAVCAFLLLVPPLSAVAGAQTAVPSLLSHRAVYSLSRHAPTAGSDVTAVKGRFEITFEVACDGWRIEQFIGFRLYHPEGAGLEHLAQLSGWESADGIGYWFTSRSYQDRALLEELGGVARLSEPGGAGETHLAELIDAARAGEPHLSRTVFDGSTLDSPYEVTAFIGEERTGEPPDRLTALVNQRSWSFRLAYFKATSVQPSPEFEMSAVLYENGVAGDMIYDYGDFSIDVTLRELEPLPMQKCAG